MDVEKQAEENVTLNRVAPLAEDTENTTDDEMLSGNDKQGAEAKKEASKLIDNAPAAKVVTGVDNHKNGDTKIKMMEPEKVPFSGMTKEELMKYANDPFWVRLRWILFILFWVVWLAMLVGAILIIIYAPKCAAPEKLSWWKTGPLVAVEEQPKMDLEALSATGVIYKIPGDDTYDLEKMGSHKAAIAALLSAYANKVKVILDMTPNYVTDRDELFRNGLADKQKRSAFIWAEGKNNEPPTNWVALGNGSAWQRMNDSSYILSQFGPSRYDLQLSDPVAKEKLKKVLQEYGKIAGVCGFRLANAKHFIIDRTLRNEEAAADKAALGHEHYNFWTHTHTTFGEGLNELLQELKSTALEVAAKECDGVFFGSADAIEYPDMLKLKSGQLTIESVPVKLNMFLGNGNGAPNATAKVAHELQSIGRLTRDNRLWVQYQYPGADASHLTEQYLFTFLLPSGVPIFNQFQLAENDQRADKGLKLAHLLTIRESPAFTTGNFEVHQDLNQTLVGYTRVTAGSPGYFVVYNPTGQEVVGNFTKSMDMEGELTVHMLSQNYKVEGITPKHKMTIDSIPVSPHSVCVLTYVKNG